MNYSDETLQSIIEWDIEVWKKGLIFFDKNIDSLENKKCLEIGARRGGMSLWLSFKGAKDILCTDYVNNYSIVSENHKAFGVENIKYGSLNVLDMEVENKYDIIIFKSVLGALGDKKIRKRHLKIFIVL